VCSDETDNDRDNKLNCADVDCIAQICRPGSLEEALRSVATRDVKEFGTNEGILQQEGTTTIVIAASPHGAQDAVLEFGDIPAEPAIRVLKATLSIYVETGGKPLMLFDADDKELPRTLAPAEAGLRGFDVTSLVQSWISNAESRRTLRIRYGALGAVVMHSTEFGEITHSPHIDIFYEAVCNSNGVCPLPSTLATPG
jgi:hypothetical protein